MWRATLILCILIAHAPAGEPRAKAAAYPAHAESAGVAIGAEYLVHSFSNGRQTFVIPGYLVVDAAVYPSGTTTFKLSQFKLRINDGAALTPDDVNMVAYSLKNMSYLDSGGMNGGGQFPGDVRGNAPPPPPQAPDPAHPERDPLESAGESLKRTAFIEGEHKSPSAGYLFFPFSGKTKKIRNADLIYTGESGELTVKLF